MPSSVGDGARSSQSHDGSISFSSSTIIDIDRQCSSSSSTLSVSVASERAQDCPSSEESHGPPDSCIKTPRALSVLDDSSPLSAQGSVQCDPSQVNNDDVEASTDGFAIPLGVVNSSIVLFSTSLSLVILGFLTFLWAGEGSVDGGENASWPWRYLVINGWLFQVVAVTSTILRFTLSVQLPLTTCLAAALVLERQAVPKSISAALSIYRGVNGGPPTLLHLLWSHRLFSIIFKTPEMILLSIIAAAAIVMQFSSTLLLSDIRDGLIIDVPRWIQPKIHLSWLGISQNAFTSTLQNPMTQFPIFGEPSSDISVTVSADGLSTARLRRHVILPGGNSDQPVRSYSGLAFTLDSELSCVPPVIEDMTMHSYFESDTQKKHGTMTGVINYGETLHRAKVRPQLEDWSAQIPRAFSCSIATGIQGLPGTTMCVINSPGNLWITLNTTQDIWRSQSQATLVFQSHYEFNSTTGTTQKSFPSETTTEGEWQQFDLKGSPLKTSMCFIRWNMRQNYVELSTDTHLERLQLPHRDLDISSFLDFNRWDVRQSLGATRRLQSLADRRVMHLSYAQPRSNGTFAPQENDLMDAVMTSLGSEGQKTNTSISLCESTHSYSETSLSSGLMVVLCDIARHTRSAPLLLHTLLKVAAQSVYTQVEDSFASGADASVVQEITRSKPVRCAGLVSVATLVLVSSACIVVIVRLYRRHIRFTKIDNFWYTISQLVSEETADTIMRSNLSPDEYVFRDREGAENHLIRLQLSDETGRVEIVRVEQP